MTQEEKDLLLKDICTRLPYDALKVQYKEKTYDLLGLDRGRIFVNLARIGEWLPTVYTFDIKPYLRPMSSMTEEEFVYFMGIRGKMLKSYEIQSMMKKALNMFQSIGIVTTLSSYSNKIDWLNKKMFAYRTIDGKDMFELGLALEAPEGMYN